MIIKFNKGKRNHYKIPIGVYISKIPIYPIKDGKIEKYHQKMRTINFRYKYNVYSIFINWRKQNE